MSDTVVGPRDPYHIGSDDRASWRDPHSEHAARDLTSKRIIVGYGFWIFLLSDIVMFSAFFATYAVLSGRPPAARAGRTCSTSTSSRSRPPACCCPASPAASPPSARGPTTICSITQHGADRAARAGFLALELNEFAGMIAIGAGPTRSAFLSSFFTLVGCHGLHVTLGLMWLLTMMAQVFAKGYRPDILRRVLCFSMFWHTLDIIWVAIFTVVYLMGVGTVQ